jgi:hypothetical protein
MLCNAQDGGAQRREVRGLRRRGGGGGGEVAARRGEAGPEREARGPAAGGAARAAGREQVERLGHAAHAPALVSLPSSTPTCGARATSAACASTAPRARSRCASTSPAGGAVAAAKDLKQLSGGERSFVTVAFALALGAETAMPLRAMHDFDVFMDAVNRHAAVENLLSFAAEQSDLRGRAAHAAGRGGGGRGAARARARGHAAGGELRPRRCRWRGRAPEPRVCSRICSAQRVEVKIRKFQQRVGGRCADGGACACCGRRCARRAPRGALVIRPQAPTTRRRGSVRNLSVAQL